MYPSSTRGTVVCSQNEQRQGVDATDHDHEPMRVLGWRAVLLTKLQRLQIGLHESKASDARAVCTQYWAAESIPRLLA
jgi:hypothetical protein